MDRTDKDIPVIALTANAFSDDVHKAQDAGMNAHIEKPIDVDKMIEGSHHSMNKNRRDFKKSRLSLYAVDFP